MREYSVMLKEIENLMRQVIFINLLLIKKLKNGYKLEISTKA